MRTPLPPEERLLPLLDRLRRYDIDAPLPDAAPISPPQALVLSAVAASPGSSLQAIARSLRLAPPTVSVTVSRLERAGLLERRPDHQDRRAIRLYLSAEGDALHRRLTASRRDRAVRLLSVLTPEERYLLVDVLDRALAGTDVVPVEPTPPRERPGIAGIVPRLVRRLRGIQAPSRSSGGEPGDARGRL